MSNVITNRGAFTYQQGNTTLVNVDTTTTFSVTQSHYTQEVISVTSAAWSGLNTSSISDMRYAVFKNLSTGSVVITVNGTAVGNLFAILASQNDVAVISWSGSVPQLYASASTTPADLYYTLHSEL